MAEPHDLPTAAQLVEAVREFLERDVMAATDGRVQFHTRVAVNALNMVQRELEVGPAQAAAHRTALDRLGVADDSALAAAIRSGGLDERVTHHATKDGTRIEVTVGASSVVVNGRVARLMVATDVTEDRERERALLESEKRLRDLIDATTAVIYVKSLDGRYLFVNERFEQLTGLARDDVLGKTDAELWPAPYAAAMRANDLRVLDALEPLEFEDHGPEGSPPVTFLAYKFPLFDPDGVPYAIAGISTDITRRKRAEDRLRRSEERFRFLAENAQDFIFRYRLKDEPGFDYVSPACVTITGYTSEELYSDPRLIFNLIEAMHV